MSMIEQQDIFSFSNSIAIGATETSKEAGFNVYTKTGRDKFLILRCISRHTDGRTDQEIVQATSISENSVRPRRGWLADEGYIMKNGKTRQRQGRNCQVWVLTLKGLAVVNAHAAEDQEPSR